MRISDWSSDVCSSDLAVGDLLAAGWTSNYGTEKPLSWIYLSAAPESAIWGCELAAGEGRERIYIVQPTGDWIDDPNPTDTKFTGKPTRRYRSRSPLRTTGEEIGRESCRERGCQYE